MLKTSKTSEDKRFLPYYGEYLVALGLAKRGHDVQVLKKKRGADIYLRDVDIRVEVKSSSIDLAGWSCAASFYNGTSIKRKDFDYCVFVIFENLEPLEYLVFSHYELMEVAENPRPSPITTYPNNRCILFRYKNLQEYEKAFPKIEDRLNIETILHQHPERFRGRWDKIVLHK